MNSECSPGRREAHQEKRNGNYADADPFPGDRNDDGRDQQQGHAEEKNVPDVTPPLDRLPRRGSAHGEQSDHHETAREVPDDLDNGYSDGSQEQHEGRRRRNTPTDHPANTPFA